MIHRKRITIEIQQEPELDVFLRPKGNCPVETRVFWCACDEEKPPQITSDVGGPLRNHSIILRAPWPTLSDVKAGDRIVAIEGVAVPPATITETWTDGVSAGATGVQCCRAVRAVKGALQ